MGDLIEITTRARHPTSFYKVSSSAISFEVKAFSAALVGLAKEPGIKCDYWFGFGGGGGGVAGNGKLWIKGPEGLKTKQGGNYTLSQNQFKRFWIAWDCGRLKIGQGHETAYILSCAANTLGLNYVTFTTHDPRHVATWRFELPPVSLISMTNKAPFKKVQGGELRWVTADEALPDDAVIGGFQLECLYIIRGLHNGSLTPGHFVPSEGVAYLSWGGSANIPPEFEILCGYNYTWEMTSDNKIPVNAFEAGYSEVHHEKLYIGRVNHNGGVVPGKVHPSHKVCYVPYEDKEVAFKNYEILTIPDSNPYPARPYFETNSDWRPMIVNENAFFMNAEDHAIDEDEDDDESNYDDDEYHAVAY